MDSIKGSREIVQPAIQDTPAAADNAASTETPAFETLDKLESSQATGLPDVQSNNFFEGLHDTQTSSIDGLLKDLDEKMNDLRAHMDVIKDHLESNSGPAKSMMQLQIGMAFDAASRLMQELANIMKLIGKTDENIIQNVK